MTGKTNLRLPAFFQLLLLIFLPIVSTAANDPFSQSNGSWEQDYNDQWYLQAVGLADESGVWSQLGEESGPIVIAVIDTGLDWYHLDFAWKNLWFNRDEIPGNNIDDDNNGYVDDLIGWDFTTRNPKPWDYDGHGTLVTGIIAGEKDNGVGIAGVNPFAQIMVLKAMNDFGRGRATFIAEAVAYAVDNGARIINISMSGPGYTEIERKAFQYAKDNNVLVVVAAGNDGKSLNEFGPAGDPNVLTVAATNPADQHGAFSNWGANINLAAPGVDILSLRARYTDTMLGVSGVSYQAGSAFVGEDNRYYRVTGTSFAVPIVSGIAALVLSQQPQLDSSVLQRILENSARDIDQPGIDNFSGYGLIDARAALAADPDYFISARIHEVAAVATEKGPAASVRVSAAADNLSVAELHIGAGAEPSQWRQIKRHRKTMNNGEIAKIPAAEFSGSSVWTLRLVVEHQDGSSRETRFQLNLN